MGTTRRIVVWCVALTVAVVGAALTALYWPHDEAVATEVSFTRAQDARYLAEMKEDLDGHPGHPRSQLVSSPVLVDEGVLACGWLAAQPAGDQALQEEDLRQAFFADHPRAVDGWPFRQGDTGVREEILTNSWGWLCRDIAQDHIAPPPDLSD